ncbi:MAG TPA: SigE family RNA polymerase sigma factor [Nocardioidaceae bacterium]|nr:SigE family RNA polymerase sigma factor [Nocardioidaceae bacterium]
MENTCDEAAFHDFVVARLSAFSRTAYLLTGDHHLAEDLVQTALFKTAKAWHRIEGSPEAYVRRILYTQNVSWWRSRRQVLERPLEAYDDRASDAEDHELRMSLTQALAQLTAKQRTVLVLRYYEDLTEAETARVLGIGVGTVKSQSRQALARLRVVAPHLGELIRTEASR